MQDLDPDELSVVTPNFFQLCILKPFLQEMPSSVIFHLVSTSLVLRMQVHGPQQNLRATISYYMPFVWAKSEAIFNNQSLNVDVLGL